MEGWREGGRPTCFPPGWQDSGAELRLKVRLLPQPRSSPRTRGRSSGSCWKIHFWLIAQTLSVGLPELQAVAGLGVLQLGVLVVPEGGPLCGLLSLESVDPPVERTVGQVIVYSSLQWENIYNHQDISQEIIEKWLNGQFSGLMTLHVKCSFYSQYSYSELLTAIMLNRGFNLHNEKPQEFPLVFTSARPGPSLTSLSEIEKPERSELAGWLAGLNISHLIYRHVSSLHGLQSQHHIVLRPVNLNIINIILTLSRNQWKYLGIFTQFYSNLLASSVQCSAWYPLVRVISKRWSWLIFFYRTLQQLSVLASLLWLPPV